MTTADTLRIEHTTLHPAEAGPHGSRAEAAPPYEAGAQENAADDRKLMLLKRSGLFGHDLKGAHVCRATTLEDLQGAYSLVHDVYLSRGYIHAEPSGMRLRIHETSSDTATFIAKADGRVVGVISVVGDSMDIGLPSDACFRPELDDLRARGIRLCEVTNQVVADEFRKSAVTTELMRCAVAHALKMGYRAGIATVSPSHGSFYDFLGFQQIGGERSYSQKIYDPVVALMIDYNHYRCPPPGLTRASNFAHHFLGPENPYVGNVHAWDRLARARFLNAELLEQLFVIRSNFLAECSPEALETVRMRWGCELFRTVACSLPGYSEPAPTSVPPFPAAYPAVSEADTAHRKPSDHTRHAHGDAGRPFLGPLRIVLPTLLRALHDARKAGTYGHDGHYPFQEGVHIAGGN